MKIRNCLVFGLSMLVCAGCAPLLIGAAVGALGGYAVSRDTVQGETDVPYDVLWNSALKAVEDSGTVTRTDDYTGLIEDTSSGGVLKVRLLKTTPETTLLKVSARKNHLPDRTRAENMFVKIMEPIRKGKQ